MRKYYLLPEDGGVVLRGRKEREIVVSRVAQGPPLNPVNRSPLPEHHISAHRFPQPHEMTAGEFPEHSFHSKHSALL